MRLLDHTQRRTTVGRTPLDERLARRGHVPNNIKQVYKVMALLLN